LVGLACALLCATAGAQPATGREREAAALYQQGLKHYNLGEYDQAIAALKRAYLLVEAPEFLFNIAQAYRKKGPGSCKHALEFYRSYLRAQPESPKRSNVDAMIADMEQCARTQPAATAAAIAPPPLPRAATAPPEDHAGRGPRLLPWVLAGGGLVVAATGAGLFFWGKSDFNAIKDSGCAPLCNRDAVDSAQMHENLGTVLLGLGGAAAAAGLVLWIAGPERPRAAWIQPTVGGVVAGAHF
jgi:tetratricopeptide (TPR) repeat protein